jgi:vitamin B12/bleomycin/antimicrobial peptide transport system ATP-binding/permease protein
MIGRAGHIYFYGPSAPTPMTTASKLPPKEVLRLFKPYWHWGNKQAILAAIILVAAVLGGSAFNAWITKFTKLYYDAIDKRDLVAFNLAIMQSLLGHAAQATLFTFDSWLKQWIDFNWRRALTADFASRWMAGNTFYRLERQQVIDNPDQRIGQDVDIFTQKAVGLGFSFLGNLGLLASFGYLLWTVAGPITVLGITIPGYMFWAAIGFGVANTAVSHWAGHQLAPTRMQQQKVEADFRFTMAQQREAAEQIAFYGGGATETARLTQVFGHIANNWRRIMFLSAKLNFAHLNFNSLSGLVPILIISPKLFSGELTLGAMMQSSMAYGATVMAVSWFSNSYQSLVELSAVARRLVELNRALDEDEARGIALQAASGPALSTQALGLALPNGQPLAKLGDITFAGGQRWLVRGPSGVGKSTLLRALAGIWPHGRGAVALPVGRRLMFVPQRSYIPMGSLKEALSYPLGPEAYTDAQCRQALALCHLPHLADQLQASDRWAHRLSGGEQQRLAFARVLLARPDFVFLDEATSALDNPTEAALYTALAAELPQATLVSVAHRETLQRHHQYTLELGHGDARVGELAPQS